jgi:hypothetical protein
VEHKEATSENNPLYSICREIIEALITETTLNKFVSADTSTGLLNTFTGSCT